MLPAATAVRLGLRAWVTSSFSICWIEERAQRGSHRLLPELFVNLSFGTADQSSDQFGPPLRQLGAAKHLAHATGRDPGSSSQSFGSSGNRRYDHARAA